MSDEPTQTTPKGRKREALGLPGEGGNVIPVPARGDVFDALRKAARLGLIENPGPLTAADFDDELPEK